VLDPVNYAIWLAVLLVEIFSFVCLLRQKAFSKHFTLVFYLCACVATDIGSYSIIHASGYESDTYFYFLFLLAISPYDLPLFCAHEFVLPCLFGNGRGEIHSRVRSFDFGRNGWDFLLPGRRILQPDGYALCRRARAKPVFRRRCIDLSTLGRHGETAGKQNAFAAACSFHGRVRELVRGKLRDE